jgi:hypothetical protein
MSIILLMSNIAKIVVKAYSCGYRDGFENALFALAQMAGVSGEFEDGGHASSRTSFSKSA